MTGIDLKFKDADGDTLQAFGMRHATGVSFFRKGKKGRSTFLTRDEVAELVHGLTEWLNSEEPADPTCERTDHLTSSCGHTIGPIPKLDGEVLTCTLEPGHGLEREGQNASWANVPPTITDEAQALVYGSRQDEYAHPRENLTRTAVLWTALLQPLLAEGAFIDAPDVARCMIGVKLARDVNSPQRDNRVDMAGYALVLDRLETGR